MTHPLYRAENLSLGYAAKGAPARILAQGLSLSVSPGEFICLVGPNGAGKSTLLRTLCGLQPALSGDLNFKGKRLKDYEPSELALSLSVVLTRGEEAGFLTVQELVALGRHPYTGWLGRLKQEDEEAVAGAMKAMGIADLAGREVHTLSDGERQKTVIARALAQNPRLMILDEPTAFLDLPRRLELMNLLRTLARKEGRAVVLSTHDLDLALRDADRIWLISPDGFRSGLPEDLVLNGDFERAFTGKGVFFDRTTGSFHIIYPETGRVRLVGSGAPAYWTRRALAREGYLVAAEGESSPLEVAVTESGGKHEWALDQGGEKSQHKSLASLLRELLKKP